MLCEYPLGLLHGLVNTKIMPAGCECNQEIHPPAHLSVHFCFSIPITCGYSDLDQMTRIVVVKEEGRLQWKVKESGSGR